MGSVTSLFWTFGNICTGFQNQGGVPRVLASFPACNRFLRFTSMMRHLLTSWWVSWQPSRYLCTIIGGARIQDQSYWLKEESMYAEQRHQKRDIFPSSIQSALHLRPIHTEQNRKQKRIISLKLVAFSLIIFAFASTFVRREKALASNLLISIVCCLRQKFL